MSALGAMQMPPDFKYLDVYQKGKPTHDRYDSFSVKHPSMDPGRRAKIFAPFDALRGFHFAIMTKEVRYVDKPELSREEERELNRRLTLLRKLTHNSRAARQNRVSVTVFYFRVCDDAQNEAYGTRGQVQTLSGICRWVDWDVTQTLRVGEKDVPLGSILRIDGADGVFSAPSDKDAPCDD